MVPLRQFLIFQIDSIPESTNFLNSKIGSRRSGFKVTVRDGGVSKLVLGTGDLLKMVQRINRASSGELETILTPSPFYGNCSKKLDHFTKTWNSLWNGLTFLWIEQYWWKWKPSCRRFCRNVKQRNRPNERRSLTTPSPTDFGFSYKINFSRFILRLTNR